MKLENTIEKELEKYFELEKSKLDLLYHSSVITKSRFNFKNKVVSYQITFSSKYGINMFLIFDHSVDEFNQGYLDIIDIVENVKKEGYQELKRYGYDSFDFNVHCYFPNIPSGYFDTNLFSRSRTNLVVDVFKDEVSNVSAKLYNSKGLISLFKALNNDKKNNSRLTDELIQLDLKGIFTYDTSPDLSIKRKLTLDNESNDIIDNLYERFELDAEQKHLVNSFNSEHRLLLAEAGTGKSVILFLKAQRLAALNPNAKVLVLAYNRYLVEEFIRKRDYENIKDSHIDIYTVDKFLDLLVKRYLSNNIYDDFDKDHRCEDLLKIIDNIEKYEAIYIDEIQQFQPQWIKLCYQILKSHNEGEHSFILCGDINQTTQNGKKNTWREAGVPSFAGRRTTLTKKYRSTKEINEFVDAFVKNVYTFASRNNLPIIEEIESNSLYNIKYNEDDKLQDISMLAKNDVTFFEVPYYITDRIPVIADYILSLRTKIDLRDTVIMYPYKEIYRVSYIELLKEELQKRDIDLANTNEEYLRYSDLKDSLALVTVQKCIGLDFKNVILIGLDTYGYDHINKRSMNSETEISLYNIDELNRELSMLYVSLTRSKSRIFIEKTDALRKNKILYSLIFGDE